MTGSPTERRAGPPPSPSAPIREAMAAQRRGDLASAERVYARLLERDPEHAQALHLLGLLRFQQNRLAEAEALLGRAVARAPQNANAWSDLGMVRVRAGSAEAALEPFSRALTLAPEHPDALNNMAQALRRLGRFHQARGVLERLVALRPASARARALLADAQHQCNDVATAIETYQSALRLAPDDRRIRLGLGDAYESAGKFKQAKMQYHGVLRRAPDDPVALARLLQLREGAADAALAARAATLADAAATPEDARVRLNVALGYYHDRRGEHDEAFRRLRLGYDVRARRQPFDSDGYSRAVDALIETLTPEFYREAPTSGLDSARPIFIVGMPRSGTTLTEQILASHSAVAAGGELAGLVKVSYQVRELSRTGAPYPQGLERIGRSALRQMARYYLDQLERISPDAARVTDKLPYNFMHLGLIPLLFPHARIVHCRRHPLDNCLSCYFTGFADQIRFANRLDTLGRYYLDYQRLMEHWHRVLPLELFDLPYEALVHDTEGRIRALLDHCGLPWEDACLSFHETERGVRTPSRWQVRQPIYEASVGRWRHYERHLAPLVRILQPLLERQPDQPGETR